MDQTHKNRMVLLSIIGIPVTMILAATWLWYYVVQGDLDLVGSLGTANRGDLVQPPRQIDEAELKEQTGFPFSLSDLEPRWTMLVSSSGPVCDKACEHSLYVTRQIHVAMGKEFKRLRRLYISDVEVAETSLGVSTLSDKRPAPASFSRLLENEHRGMKQVTASTAELEQLFPELGEDRTTWYLVDPAGWIMMSYNTEVPYKDVIGDLKFLLKNSSE
jgi:hypothetical protein